jgi:O-antigen ligase
MAFVLTLIYIALSLLSPKDSMPYLAEYRLELLVVLLALFFSMPKLLDRSVFRIPQNYLLLGLMAAVFLSIAIGDHWMGGGLIALQRFLPSAIIFYLVLLNCQTIGRLQMVVWLLVAIAAFYVVEGGSAYLSGEINSKLLEVIPVSDGSVTFRLQGLGFLHDPNEFAQLLVTILPFLWLAWKPCLPVRNLLFVLTPTGLFIWGIYLTHSRGAVLALVVILMLELKDRVSLVSTAVGGALAFVLMLALDFSGGREISLESGANRLEMWGNGLELFRQSPLFGIGFQGFAGQNSGHTAHNTFVVCLAELGVFGYAFWVALVAFTLAGLNSLIASLKPMRSSTTLGEEQSSGLSDPEHIEFDHWARTLRISMAGYLAAAFFLSRAYSLTLYLVLGMAAAVLYMTWDEDLPFDREPAPRLIGVSAAMGVAAIALVYASLRLRSF